MNANDNERPQRPVVGPFRDPLTLSDEHVNQSRRFAGLPRLDAKELKSWRGYLRWMRERFAPRSSSDTPPQS